MNNVSFTLGFVGYLLVCMGIGGYVIGRLAKPGNFYAETKGQRFVSAGARARMDPSARWYNIAKNVAAPLSTILGGILTSVSHLLVVGADAKQNENGATLIVVGIIAPPIIAIVALVVARFAVIARGRHLH